MSSEMNTIVSLTIDFVNHTNNITVTDFNTTLSQDLETNQTLLIGGDGGGGQDDDDLDYTLRNIIVIIFYTIIICVSFCGNLLVLRVIFGKRKMRTTTNLLIGSLALADFLTTTLNIPFNVTRFIMFNYPFGRVLCILVPFIQVCCVYVSTLTMGVIAIHRFWTILGSQTMANKSLSTFKLGVIILVVWIIAGVLALPHSAFNRIVPTDYKNVTYSRCRVVYPNLDFDFPFWLSIEAFFTQYLIPLSITCTLYIKIGFVVAKQGRLAGKASDERKKQHDDARRRRIVMLVLVVAAFGFSWFPLNTYHLLVDFKIVAPDFNIFLICHWIAMSSVCYNPFIYCWLNESFRKGAQKLFHIICCCFNKKSTMIEEDHRLNNESMTKTTRTTLPAVAKNRANELTDSKTTFV